MKEIFWSWIDTIAERDVAVALAPIFRVNKGRTKGAGRARDGRSKSFTEKKDFLRGRFSASAIRRSRSPSFLRAGIRTPKGRGRETYGGGRSFDGGDDDVNSQTTRVRYWFTVGRSDKNKKGASLCYVNTGGGVTEMGSQGSYPYQLLLHLTKPQLSWT